MSLFCRRILSGIVITVFALASYANAQNSNDRGTPADSKKGQSTQSTYARDKIETVNLANGNLSLSIPLATVGGRGSASFTIALSYNSKVWSTESERNGVFTENGAQGTPRNIYSTIFDKAQPEDYEPYMWKLGGGWSILTSPGIKLRMSGIDPLTIGCNHFTDGQRDCGFKYALTKMWVTLPDGSQLELRDVATQGAPARTTHLDDNYHYLEDRDRGRIWRSVDGSGVIFVRDTGYPVGQIGGQNEFPNGWVFSSDGTRLRMDQGVCSKIIDRNGNFITINGNGYTDELGRQTLFQIVSGVLALTVRGYGGVPDRSLSINTGVIGDLANLRADFHSLPRPFTTGDAFRDALDNFSDHTIQGPHTDLFIHSEGYSFYGTEGLDVGTKTAVTQLNLLDGRALRFRYNQYGEVAEIVYPGGGVSQIDYGSAPSSGCEIPAPFNVNRGVSQRRTLTNGVDVDATWLYLADAEWIDGVYRPGVKVEAHQGAATGTLLAKERHFFRMLNAEYRQCGGPYTGTGNEKWENAKEFRTETYTGTGTTVTVRDWQQRAAVVWANDVGLTYNTYVNDQGHGQDQPPNDPRVMWEETTLEDGKVKRVEYGYDQFNNVTSIKEYDFGTAGAPGNLLRQTSRTYRTALNGYCYSNLNPLDPSCGSGLAADVTAIIYQPGLLLSETVKDGSDNQKARTDFEYDNYAGTNHAALVPNSGMIQYDGSRFSNLQSATQPRGNVTQVTRWLGGGTDVVAYSQYDNAGQVIWSKDPNGNVSTVSYADNFGSGDNPDAGVSGPNGATYALASVATNAVGHVVKMQYDYSLGAATGVKDANNVITKTEYDSLGRPFRATAALGLAEQSVSQMSYPTLQENSARVSKQLDTTSGVTRWLTAKTDFDGFDRPKTSWQSEDGQSMSLATFTIRADTIYDAIGRVKQVSNPYRPATETAIYTTTAYDLAGRVISVTTPDSAVVTSSYYANTVTVSDQTQKQRKSVTDALGRLKEVYEAPNDSNYNYLTSYGCDTMDNLTSVSQGTQTRTFAYDSLKRLTSATNPESGTINYQYDNNGNLTQKTDARGVVTTYAYDVLNRNTSIVYTNDPAGTPAVHRYYDGWRDGNFINVPNVKGRLWQTETSGASGSRTTINSFDPMGRPLSQSQQFYSGTAWSQAYTVQRTPYDLAGGVTSQTYPSGHAVTYNYDAAGRLSDKNAQNLAFTGNLGDGITRTYSSGILYSSLGGMTKEKFGTDTAIYNKLFYNVRGQLAEIREGTSYTGPNDTGWERGAIINFYGTCWGMCGGQNSTTSMPENNGNLRRQEIYIPNGPMFAQTFDYDSLNRLQRVTEGSSWQQEYVYDRYGNRTIHQTNTWGPSSGPLIPKPNFEVQTSTNRLYAPGDLALAEASRQMQYDDAGNLKKDKDISGAAVTRAYDAENRMASETRADNSVAGSYTYNADGQRVRRKVNGVETWQVYGLDGELLAEYAANAALVSPQKEYGYRNGQLLITAEAAATPRTNVATTAAGATATAQNYTQDSVYPGYHWQPPFAIDGQRYSHLIADGSDGTGVWRDEHGLSSWLEVAFNGAKTIDEVDVFTVANYPALMTQADPPATQTITQFGATAFAVQYWTGSAWATVPNGSITGNNLVWRKINFAAITTSKIRVVVSAAIDGVARVAEVEAWGSAASINWLVTDQLGTPRMIFDQSGSLATTKRHDYLPFGEEVFAGTGGRTATMGYSGAGDVRQKFTQKERDIETGLDYFLARYYSSTQGRFTSPDEFKGGPDELYVLGGGDQQKQALPYAEITQPGSLNKYTYSYNNPLRFVDPDGHCGTPSGLKSGQVGICVASFIKTKIFSPFPPLIGPGRGDGRGANGQGGTSRVEVRVIVDPGKGTVTKTDETMGRSGIVIKDFGLQGSGGSNVSELNKDKQGNMYFQINQHGDSAMNVENVVGTIDNHLNMVATPDNKVGITPSSTAKDYPSLEVHKYTMDAKGNVTTTQVFVKQETAPGALKRPEQPVKADLQ